MRALVLTAATLIGITLPLVALAQTTASPSASTLLAELTALEQQIASLSATASATATPSTPAATTSNMCPALYRTLSYGSSGSDVASLQTYLAAQGDFNGTATGYFGSITQVAVAQWQENNGVVSGGDANSTGLGVVGPMTRAAIAHACGGTVAAKACLEVQPPATDCPTNWQPVSDANGCTIYYQCVISLPSVASTSASVVPTTTSTTSSSASCPVVTEPTCPGGTVSPFQTDANGCVLAYECVL